MSVLVKEGSNVERAELLTDSVAETESAIVAVPLCGELRVAARDACIDWDR